MPSSANRCCHGQRDSRGRSQGSAAHRRRRRTGGPGDFASTSCLRPVRRSSTPSPRAATKPPSGCIHRAARARPGLRTPAARHGGVRGTVWPGRPRHPSDDRTFSVAKLFFAYGLGNALYFRSRLARRRSSGRGRRLRRTDYEVIERHRPTLFYSVPTGYAMCSPRPSHETGGLRSVQRPAGDLRRRSAATRPLRRFKQRFGVDILDGIGSTEVLHMFISNRPGAVRPGSSGLVVPGYESQISTR